MFQIELFHKYLTLKTNMAIDIGEKKQKHTQQNSSSSFCLYSAASCLLNIEAFVYNPPNGWIPIPSPSNNLGVIQLYGRYRLHAALLFALQAICTNHELLLLLLVSNCRYLVFAFFSLPGAT